MKTNKTGYAKNTTIEMSLTADYRRSWGLWEALREIIQNGLDGEDEGFPLFIERSPGQKKTISIRNEGVVLPREKLLLGSTSKADGGSRGRFGEGFKLALLTLARKGIEVQVRTGDEMWTPSIEESTQMDANILCVKIRQQPKFVNFVEFQVHNLSDEAWALIQGNLLDIKQLPSTVQETNSVVDTGRGKILLDPSKQGKLFSRGLVVGKLPDEYAYGYDLYGLELDHDRKMADPWSLKSLISDTLRRAVDMGAMSGQQIINLLNTGRGEAQTLASCYRYGGSDGLSKAVAEAFKAAKGDVTPVTSMEQSIQADHLGMQSAMVSSDLAVILEKELGSFEALAAKQSTEACRLYGITELTLTEKENLTWAMTLVEAVSTVTFANLQIVDFYDANLNGLCQPGTKDIRIAKRQLTDRKAMLRTLVHEVAHYVPNAIDGSTEHRNEMDRIFSEIVAQLAF